MRLLHDMSKLYFFQSTVSYSYLRHRQVVLFVYMTIMCIIFYIYTYIVYIYCLQGIYGVSYGLESYFDMFYRTANYITFEYIYSSDIGITLSKVFDMLYNILVSSSHSTHNPLPRYELFYNNGLWFEECGSCKGRGTLPAGGTSNILAYNKMCISFDLSHYDVGFIYNSEPSYLPLYNVTGFNDIKVNYGIHTFFSVSAKYLNNYLDVSGFLDESFSSLLSWREGFRFGIIDKMHLLSRGRIELPMQRRAFNIMANMSNMYHAYSIFEPLKLFGRNISCPNIYSNMIISDIDCYSLKWNDSFYSISKNKSFPLYSIYLGEANVQCYSISELVFSSLYDAFNVIKSLNMRGCCMDQPTYLPEYLDTNIREFKVRITKAMFRYFNVRLFEYPQLQWQEYSDFRSSISSLSKISNRILRIEPSLYDQLWHPFWRDVSRVCVNSNFYLKTYNRVISEVLTSPDYPEFFILDKLMLNDNKRIAITNNNYLLFLKQWSLCCKFQSDSPIFFMNFLKPPTNDDEYHYNSYEGFFEGIYHYWNGVSYMYTMDKILGYLELYDDFFKVRNRALYSQYASWLKNVYLPINNNRYSNMDIGIHDKYDVFSKDITETSTDLLAKNERGLLDYVYIRGSVSYELDVAYWNYFHDPLVKRVVNSNCYEFYMHEPLGNHPYTMMQYGYGLHNLWIFSTLDWTISKHDAFRHLFSAFYDWSLTSVPYMGSLLSGIYCLLKSIYLVYPCIFIVICTFLSLHILYAYEFLINDYVECAQFRIFFSKLLAYIIYLYLYLSLLDLFLSDIFIFERGVECVETPQNLFNSHIKVGYEFFFDENSISYLSSMYYISEYLYNTTNSFIFGGNIFIFLLNCIYFIIIAYIIYKIYAYYRFDA